MLTVHTACHLNLQEKQYKFCLCFQLGIPTPNFIFIDPLCPLYHVFLNQLLWISIFVHRTQETAVEAPSPLRPHLDFAQNVKNWLRCNLTLRNMLPGV